MSDAAALASAARELIGTPFRLRGRDPETGVDCIGLVCAALTRIGRMPPPLPRYQLRNLDLARFASLLPAVGLRPRGHDPRAGDVLILRPSAAQFHLGIIDPSGRLIHAHGGLGRVVASPAPLPWPIKAGWHLTEL